MTPWFQDGDSTRHYDPGPKNPGDERGEMAEPRITIREAVLDGRRLTGNAIRQFNLVGIDKITPVAQYSPTWKDYRGEWWSLRVIGHDKDGNPCRSFVFIQDRPDAMCPPRDEGHINAEVYAEWDKLPQVILGR